MERRVKSDLRNKLFFIGCLQGKYKHLLTFKSLLEISAETTQKEYEKKGVQVEQLNAAIFPLGKVWLPTSKRYLLNFMKIISGIPGSQAHNVLDLGCGSGILSFLFAKTHKKSRVIAVDKNPDAVNTTNVNAAKLQLSNVEALQFDLLQQKDFEVKTMEFKVPKKFDYVIINPPWLSASKFEGESMIAEGVYDKDSMVLENSLKLASTLYTIQKECFPRKAESL